MKVKIIKPVPGMAYFGGETPDLKPTVCAKWIQSGHMIAVPETEDDKNTLPEDLPGREILFNEGMKTIGDVKKVKETLTDFKGIGAKTAADIIKYIESLS